MNTKIEKLNSKFSFFLIPLMSLSLLTHETMASTQNTSASVSPNDLSAKAHFHPFAPYQTLIANTTSIKTVGGTILTEDPLLSLSIATLSQDQMNQLSLLNHTQGRCAGFEILDEVESTRPARVFSQIKRYQNDLYQKSYLRPLEVSFNSDYQTLAKMATPDSLKKTIQWFSSYSTRYNKNTNPNKHVEDLEKFLFTELKSAPWKFTVEKITHQSTPQKSLRVTIPGTLHPEEVIVIGAHFDSINQSFFNFSKLAPGADDNASGSANILEALKILKNWNSFDRTLEFYWYAGEESGLLGSAEIAKQARSEGKNVKAVLQLDMTLFPGMGKHKIGLINDFTSPQLTQVFKDLNRLYVGAELVDDQCGYGCSDHASWFRQGYETVLPFEATSSTMNRNIHTEKDVINTQSDFEHSNDFTQFAVLFSLTLANGAF